MITCVQFKDHFIALVVTKSMTIIILIVMTIIIVIAEQRVSNHSTIYRTLHIRPLNSFFQRERV